MGEESKNKSRMARGYALVVTASRTLPRHLRKEKVKKKKNCSLTGRGVCVYAHTRAHMYYMCISDN